MASIKRGKRPTRLQKKLISDKLGLKPEDWLVMSETKDSIILQSKLDKTIKTCQIPSK